MRRTRRFSTQRSPRSQRKPVARGAQRAENRRFTAGGYDEDRDSLCWPGMAMPCSPAMSAGAQQTVPPVNATLPEMPKQTTRTGKHVNRVIDMWLKGQPVYYAQISGGGYEQGKEMAATKADYITYEMEHGPLDFKELREFMRGLVEAGPTRTGHKTPAVIVTLPIAGTTDALRANAWMIQQALAAGVHGILLCNAESPEAARLMIEAARYPFAPRVEGLAQGTRGNGSQGYAATNVGRHAAGVHAHRRAVADEPRWRIPVRPEDRKPACRCQRRKFGPRPRNRVR